MKSLIDYVSVQIVSDIFDRWFGEKLAHDKSIYYKIFLARIVSQMACTIISSPKFILLSVSFIR